VIVVAVRWYLRYGLSYRDVEELLAERSIEVDHVTVYGDPRTPTVLALTEPGSVPAEFELSPWETYVYDANDLTAVSTDPELGPA
jgi:hypothetical protein